MALFDKVKAQATQIAQKAQEAGKAGQAKIEDVQARRRADGLFRDLGSAIYAERSGRANAMTESDITRLVGELAAFEAENGPFGTSPSGEAETSEHDPETKPDGGFTIEP